MDSGNKMDKLHLSIAINRCRRLFPDYERKKIRDSSGNNSKDTERECCMCGDVGFQELLFKCNRCHQRIQHLYCSRLYYNQYLDLDGVNVCDWCLHFQAKEKIQSHKSIFEMQETETKKSCKKVAATEIVPGSTSTSAMKQPASVIMKKPRKANPKQGTLKLQVKFGGSKRSNTKGGFRGRYRLLSDLLCSPGQGFLCTAPK